MKILFDFLFSLIGLFLLSPLFLVIVIWILIDSPGDVFYIQQRVGKDNVEFSLIKFRTMIMDADQKGLITVGNNDARITRSGAFLRKYKLDELPQLINVMTGEMSFVGPRPEVRKYVDMYTEEQKKVLTVKPGITDLASIEYADENELLAKAPDPEKYYVEVVMPAKLKISLEYIRIQSFEQDIRLIFKTFTKIFT